MGKPKWESEVWRRCRAKKAVLITNTGESDDKS
jgi:hypothetical protein